MKASLNIFVNFLKIGVCLIWLFSCEGELVAPSNEDDALKEELPDFNFQVRQLDIPLSNAVSDSVLSDTLPVEMYLKQLDFSAPEEHYTLIVSFPADFDSEILYKDTLYRSGDWINIAYRELVDHTTTIYIIPWSGVTGPSTQPKYLINMICQDRKSNVKTATLTLFLDSK